MFRYILRRAVQMIPTVLGVIVITFVLFNVVGGSPAQMTLGKHVSPRALEDFDEQRGANKPLLAGRWTTTRAYEDGDFELHAGPWRNVKGVEHVARSVEPAFIRLAGKGEYRVPVAFPLRPDARHRWLVSYRLSADGRAALVRRKSEGEAEEVHAFEPCASWRKVRIGVDPGEAALAFLVDEGALEVRDLKLRRGMGGILDSQLVFYLKQIAKFDFGVSSSTNQRVSKMLLDGILPSLALTVPIFIIGIIVSIGLSLICAFFRDSWVDRGFVLISVVLMSVNYLVYIVVGQYVFAYRLGWFPIWGFESARYLVLPVVIGVASGLGGSLRFYRTVMLDEMYRDYVRTAFAKGVSRPGVLFRHVLKNAMIPIVTNVVIAIPFLYTGSLLLESFFGIPGLGYMGINAINSSDVDVVRALVFIGAVLYVAANLLTDLCYALVDPRVKLG